MKSNLETASNLPSSDMRATRRSTVFLKSREMRAHIEGICKRCGSITDLDPEACKPRARAIFPDGTVKEWIVQTSSKHIVFVCSCGTWGVAKQ